MNIVADKFLYHYTSFEGLKGILESKKLWLVSSLEMNDVTDRFYANLYVLIALYGSDDPDVKLLLDNLTEQDILEVNMETFDAHFYSASFCTNFNNEYLWENYAKNNTGVAICFDKENFLSAIQQIFLKYRNSLDELHENDASPQQDIISFRKVLYGTPEDKFLEVVHNLRPMCENEITQIYYKTWLLSILSVCAGMIKAKKFENEDEVRILFQSKYSRDYINNHPFHLIYDFENGDVLGQLGLLGEPMSTSADPKKRFELDLSHFWGSKIIPCIVIGKECDRLEEIRDICKNSNLSGVRILNIKGEEI